jgi:hypothetical protein
LIALPAHPGVSAKPIWLFAEGSPAHAGFRTVID